MVLSCQCCLGIKFKIDIKRVHFSKDAIDLSSINGRGVHETVILL